MVSGCPPRCRDGFRLATHVDGTQVEEVDPIVNEQDDLLLGIWSTTSMLRDPDQVPAVLPDQHNRLSLRPVRADKGETGMRDTLKQIPIVHGINVPGDAFHDSSCWLFIEGYPFPSSLYVIHAPMLPSQHGHKAALLPHKQVKRLRISVIFSQPGGVKEQARKW
jgi:hypothetical protein